MASKFVQGNWLLPNNVNANKQSNYSFDFDGQNDSINASCDFNISTEVSVSAWVKTNTNGGQYDTIVLASSSGASRYGLEVGSSGKAAFVLRSGTVQRLESTTVLSDNTWKHIVGTYDGANTKIYINGNLENTGSKTGTIVAATSLAIGGNGSYLYEGKIDEINIFSRALSSGEVSSLWNSGTPGNPFDLSGDPIAYYKLGETAVGQAPGGTWDWQVPNHAQSQLGWQGLPQNAWDGGSGGGGQNLGTTHTISYWLNNNNHNNSGYKRAGWFGIYQSTSSGGAKISGNNNFQSQGIIYGNGGSQSADANMPVSGNYITYRTGSNAVGNNMQFPLGSIDLQDNQTYNIIFVRDGGSVKCFVNGQELQNPVGSINASFELIYQYISNYTYYSIQRGWGGIMTNVAIWKSDRESEVDNIYNNGEPQSNYTTAPDIWYKFDDTTTSYPSQYKRSVNSSLSSESYVKSYLQQPFYNGAGGSHNYIYSTLDSDLNLGTSYSFSFWMGFRTDRENFYGYYNKYNIYYLGTNTSNTNVSGILEQDVYAGQPNTGSNVNTLVFTLYDSNGNTATGLNLANSGTPSLNTAFDGQLHNYMFVKDGQTVSFYFDNQLVASSTMAGELSNTVLHNINGSDGGNALARTNYTASAEWSFFANKVLTASERATIYNSGEPGDISSTSPTIWYSYDNIDVTNEKLLNKGSSSTNASILRRSGSNMNAGSSMSYIKYRDGVQAGTADLTSTDLGLHNPLYSQFSNDFNGTAGITTGGITAITPSNSICFWFNNSTAAGGQAPLMASLNYTANTGENFAIRLETTNKIDVVLVKNNTYVVLSSNTVLADNTWYFITLTTLTSGSNVTTTLYINGTQDLTATATNHSNLSDLQNGLTIGYWTAPGGETYNFNGTIDDTSIFNYALSLAQILQIYNNGKPSNINSLSPISWWRLGDSSYTNSSNYYVFPNEIANAPDGIGNAAYKPSISADAPKVVAPGVSSGLVELDKKGDAPNSASNAISYNILKTDQSVYTPKYVSQYTVDNNYSMAFDGTNDYFNIGNVSSLNFERTDVFSISAWVKRVGSGTTQFIFSKATNSSPYTGYSIYINPSNQIASNINISYASNHLSVNGNSTLNTSWNHVCVTYDGSSNASGIKLYVNGSEETTSSTGQASITGTLSNSYPVNIAARNSSDLFFDGQIDEVAIFDKTLTADQIKFDIYEASATANKSADFINNPNLPTPVVWYRMGD